MVVRDTAFHVIGLKTQCLWVTYIPIPGLHCLILNLVISPQIQLIQATFYNLTNLQHFANKMHFKGENWDLIKWLLKMIYSFYCVNFGMQCCNKTKCVGMYLNSISAFLSIVKFKQQYFNLASPLKLEWAELTWIHVLKSQKNFEKIAILKIWQLVFFRGVKTYFLVLPLKWCIFNMKK